MPRPAPSGTAIIVGAGAAGLAAAAHLTAAGFTARVLEARERIGGRAQTVLRAGFPLDLGCGWLHSADRNPWSEIAAKAGFTVDKAPPAWSRQTHDLGFARADQLDFRSAMMRFRARLDANSEDVAAAQFLEPGCRWNALLDAESAYVSGAELSRVSARDLVRYKDSGLNWRIVEGYGTAVAAYGSRLPVETNCAVTLIDHGASPLRVETTRGAATADFVIVTVPTALIGAETIRFTPELPDKIAAASALPLGLADKLVMALDAPDMFPADGHLIGDPFRTATASYHLRPFGRPLIEGFFGGELARDLERAGPGAFFDFAASELAGLAGDSIRARLQLLSETRWAADPFARGLLFLRPARPCRRPRRARRAGRRPAFLRGRGLLAGLFFDGAWRLSLRRPCRGALHRAPSRPRRIGVVIARRKR